MGAQAVRLSNVDIDKALENKDFEVLFQPIFDLGNGALARMESFVRWRHPALGVLPPGAFISFFESQGRMSELSRYMLGEALTAYMQWRGPFAPGFSINLALTDLADEAFPQHFKKLLRDRDFPADLITLECPMPLVDADIDMAKAQYARLKETGARLAIEVRGRANEFLRQIEPFPFDEIKTGGASILRFARTVRGPGLSAISDLLDIANKANAAITAVGVEDQASLAALRGLGFTAAQGNHLANVGGLKEFMPSRVNEVRKLLNLPPLGADDLAALFRTGAPAVKPADEDAVAAPDSAGDDALIDRLNERAASHTPQSEKQPAATGQSAEAVDADRRAKAREKAKALALAKRAKARELRKAAAIKRAKAKAAIANKAETGEEAATAAASPQAMQHRIVEEFVGAPERASAAASDTPTTASERPASPAKQKPLPLEPIRTESGREENSIPAATGGDIKPDTVIDSDFTPIEQTSPVSQPKGEKASVRPARENQPEPPMQIKIRSAGGQFWPVVRIGGPAKDARLHPLTGTPSAPLQNDASAPALRKTPEKPVIQGDLQTEYAAETPATETSAPVQQPSHRKKNFLQRKYFAQTFPRGLKTRPTHFWPKSWKRRLRRMKAAENANPPSAENQAAE